MKSRLKKVFIASFILSCLFNGTVFARDLQRYNQVKNTYVDSGRLASTEQSSYDIVKGTARSTAMGAAKKWWSRCNKNISRNRYV